MTLEKPLPMKKAIPLLLIGLLIFVLFLHFFVGIGNLVQSLQRANLVYYSIAFFAVLLDTLFYSLAWQYFLRPLSVKAPLRKCFLFVWVGTFVDLVVPAESISGEISKTYLMSKNSDGKAGEVVASIVSHRILNMAIILTSLIAASAIFIIKYPGELLGPTLNILMIVIIGMSISILLLLLLCFNEQVTQKIIDWIIRFITFIFSGRWRLDYLRAKTQKMLEAFHRGIDTLGKNPISLAPPVTFSIISWFFSVLIAFFVFVSLDQPISFSAIIIVNSLGMAIQTIPLGVPGEIGLTEIVMTSLYALLGIPVNVSAAATVLIRIVTFWFRLLVGYVAVQWVGVKALMGGKR